MYRCREAASEDDDRDEAVKWFMIAFEMGDNDSAFDLARMYHEGVCVPFNGNEAAKWYKIAAENGDNEAAEILGKMYEEGVDIPQNIDEAIRWYKVAINRSRSGEALLRLRGNGPSAGKI